MAQGHVHRVLLFELNHRADEMVAIEADTSDTLFADIDRNAVEEDHSKITFRLILSSQLPPQTSSVAKSDGHF